LKRSRYIVTSINNSFKTKREEIEYYALELLNAEKEFSRSEIKNHVNERSGKEFTEGSFASALRKLVNNNPRVISLKRGYYQLTKNEQFHKDNFDNMTVATLKRFILDINKLAHNINPLYVTEKQQKIFDILKCEIEHLNNSVKKVDKVIQEEINPSEQLD